MQITIAVFTISGFAPFIYASANREDLLQEIKNDLCVEEIFGELNADIVRQIHTSDTIEEFGEIPNTSYSFYFTTSYV